MLERPTPRTAGVLGTHGTMSAVVRVAAEGPGDVAFASTREVELVVREVDLDTCAVYHDGRKCGWIHRDGRYYIAFSGEIPERAHECGHALLWDEAAAMLLAAEAAAG
jgi:hypothetical protein